LADLEALHFKYLSEAADAGQVQTQEGAFTSGGIKMNTQNKAPRGGRWD
jgi:hypothetical protein